MSASFVKRADWPINRNCARCGAPLEWHTRVDRLCSPGAVRRVIKEGRTRGA